MRGDINFKGSDSSDLSVYFLFCAAVTQTVAGNVRPGEGKKDGERREVRGEDA